MAARPESAAARYPMTEFRVYLLTVRGLSASSAESYIKQVRRALGLGGIDWKSAESIAKTTREAGLSGTLWDGKTLAVWIEQQYGVSLGVRQCQRIFRQLGFRLRKPRPALAQANPERQSEHKKNSRR